MVDRVLICSNFYPPFFVGGAEIIAHEQARRLSKAGYQVSVFCGKHDDSRPRYSIIRETYDHLAVFRIILHSQDYQIGQDFYKPDVEDAFEAVLEEIQPSVIHFHNLIGLSLGIIERAYRRGIRTVLTLHDHWGFCFRNTLLKESNNVCRDFSKCQECLPEFLDQQGRIIPLRMRNDYIAMQLSRVSRLISPSAYLASAYIKAGIPSEKVSVISYGVDVERFSRIQRSQSQGPMRFTFIGYLGVHKGLQVLINAIEQLLKNGYLGELCIINIVGVGGMADELDRFVRERQISSAVKLWGRVEHSQIETVYQATDVLLTTSIWPENEPVTILEAKAAGIPVLASALGGNLNLVEDNVSGHLFEPGNASILAEKIVEMARDRQGTTAMGQKAYEQIKEDTLENYVKHIAKVYTGREDSTASTSAQIVLCSGSHVSPECARVITKFDQSNFTNRYRFVLSDWMKPEDWKEAELFWVVDNSGHEQDIFRAMQLGIPILVPTHNQKLVDLCRSQHCGLFYADEAEAEACLQYLKSHPSLLAALGQNARAASEESLAQKSSPWRNLIKIFSK